MKSLFLQCNLTVQPVLMSTPNVTAGSVSRGTDDSDPRVTVTTEKKSLSGEMSRMS